ncbi:hypothetical protein ABZ714_14375 [Streptomyces sp. NPDC006798]|uniref:hypothetical protein n=1 Tax=unclassified Streptomyces TaxID=2593676 RepID=UPI0033D977CB
MTTKTFTFEHKGEQVSFEKDFSGVATPRWLRQNRNRDDLDQLFTLIEEFGGEAAVTAVDDMDASEFAAFSAELGKELQKAMKDFGDKAAAAAK